MSTPQKPVKEKVSLHKLFNKPGEIHIPHEFSTFSTGFSTGVQEKNVDKSGQNKGAEKIPQIYTILWTNR